MDKFLLILCSIFSFLHGIAQSNEEIYKQSLLEIKNRNYEKAISLMNEFIKKDSSFRNIHMIYFNRAGAKMDLKDYEGAINDYSLAIKLDSNYADAIRLRGYVKKLMGNFGAALEDYNLAIKTNPKLGYAYYNKAIVLDSLNLHNESCENYEKALELGITNAARNIYKYCDSNSLVYKKYAFKILVDTSEDVTYGYTCSNPIKVGHNPTRETALLNLLRDAQGNPIKFKREGSLGMYYSDNAPDGIAITDVYKIVYKDILGKETITELYLSFYDYEQPKIPIGFQASKN